MADTQKHFCIRSGHDVEQPPKAKSGEKQKTHSYCKTCRMFTCEACAKDGHKKVDGYCTWCGQYDGSKGTLTGKDAIGNGTSTESIITMKTVMIGQEAENG